MNSTELKKSIDGIIIKQREEALRMNEKSWYYGPSGTMVSLAVDLAATSINSVLVCEPAAQYLHKIISSVETVFARFKDEYEDVDGYGSATFHEMLRELRELQPLV
jgi:hypothetical protein